MTAVDVSAGFILPRSSFTPAYLAAYRSGELVRKVERAREALRLCRLCPRECSVDRLSDKRAFCRVGRHARVVTAFPHFGEEACLRGWKGSGAIFFAHCCLRCVFCPGPDFEVPMEGEEATPDDIAERMLDLQSQGCHNINLVTPEHVVPQVLEALCVAAEKGLRLPLVYNSSGYDGLESLELLDGVVDIYLPDFKLWDGAAARRLLKATDYPRRARAALRAMYQQVGDLVFDEDGLALRGLLVRHLLLPGRSSDSREILRFVKRRISPDTYVHLAIDYRPAGEVLSHPGQFPELEHPVTSGERRDILRAARRMGLWRIQVDGSARPLEA